MVKVESVRDPPSPPVTEELFLRRINLGSIGTGLGNPSLGSYLKAQHHTLHKDNQLGKMW